MTKRAAGGMDLYKVIIVVSLVLLPAAIGFVYWVDKALTEATAALDLAVRPGGDLEQIGLLQKQLEVLKANTRLEQVVSQPRPYFRGQIMSHTTGGLSVNEIEVDVGTPKKVGRQQAEDIEVEVRFNREGQKSFPLPRDFVHMVVHNCETKGSQVWKLRRLTMRNSEVAATRSNEAPPKSTEKDLWEVRRLTFARRQPATGR